MTHFEAVFFYLLRQWVLQGWFWFGLCAFVCVRVRGFSFLFASVQFVANGLIESF